MIAEETLRRFGLKRRKPKKIVPTNLTCGFFMKEGTKCVSCTWTPKNGGIEAICNINGKDSEPHPETDPDLFEYLQKYFCPYRQVSAEESEKAYVIIKQHIEMHKQEAGL
jgi:hypothetical protein